jgi:hypothetical protein
MSGSPLIGAAGRESAAVFTRNEATPSSVAGCPLLRGGEGAKDEAMGSILSVFPRKFY